jgi:hypothetical protein
LIDLGAYETLARARGATTPAPIVNQREEVMRHSKLRIKAFGLTVAVALSLMAFTAAAQAEVLAGGGNEAVFQIQGGSALLATLTGESEGQVRILEPARNLTIRCNTLDFVEGKILTAKEALIKITYLECVALEFSNESQEIANCKLINGAIPTTLRALPRTHEGKPFILLEGDGANIGTIQYEKEKGCVLPSTSPIQGSVIGEVTTGEAVQPLLQFKEATEKLFGDKINYGTFQLVLDASITLELTGTHKGMSLGIL